MLQDGGDIICEWLTKIFNACLFQRKVPKAWCKDCIILLFKKGSNKEIKNYGPISLLSHLYKFFTSIIKHWLNRVLDENKPVEQAGFRNGFSTTDHMHTYHN